MKGKWIFCIALLFPTITMAFDCHVTLVKNSCWVEDYEVTVALIDTTNNGQLTTLSVPAGKVWGRTSFSCQPGQRITYSATFKPSFWEGHEKDVFTAKHFWFLPAKAKPNEKAWSIDILYPQAFAEVPFPPKVAGNCRYDTSTVTPIAPVKAE